MSRGLSSTIKTALASSNYYLAFLLKLEFNSTYYLTNANNTITYSGNDYVSTGLYINISDLQEENRLTTSSLDLTLSASATGIMMDLLTNGYIDKQVTIYITLLDSDMAIIDAPFEIFKGNVDTMNVNESLETSVVRLVLTNHWAKLDQINGRYITNASQQRFFSADKCFDRANQVGKQLEWGIEK